MLFEHPEQVLRKPRTPCSNARCGADATFVALPCNESWQWGRATGARAEGAVCYEHLKGVFGCERLNIIYSYIKNIRKHKHKPNRG